jgi:hypothetical protein
MSRRTDYSRCLDAWLYARPKYYDRVYILDTGVRSQKVYDEMYVKIYNVQL